jgi:cellulose synthase/poly-beta-1,6-N-acetylglucosamine synthase-like glycosyltransferase
VTTIDADTIIHPSYIRLLTNILNDPANRNVGVAQTPYSTFPSPPSKLERTAGATTDIQYILHQGFHHYDAAFWVGANAVLRFAAIDSIKHESSKLNPLKTKYVSDRTVIEDTESSIDLAHKGWKIYNHPERLAYSSTPPDYGSLIIQRHRWANGGLLILPNLLKLNPSGTIDHLIFGTLLRLHYLISIPVVNIGLILLFILPFANFDTIWLPLTAVPYYFLYARDLKQNGYQYRDILRIYSLNLLLIPVNIAGVYASLVQLVSGNKSPFKRTPKVNSDTNIPRRYLVFPALIGFALLISTVFNLMQYRYVIATFAFLNAYAILYSILNFAKSDFRIKEDEILFAPVEQPLFEKQLMNES